MAKFTTWRALEDFILKHDLPYRVEKVIEQAPCKLVDTYTGKTVTYYLRDAEKLVR